MNVDYSKSNLGGIRNRHLDANEARAIRDEFERATGGKITHADEHGMTITLPDGPPKRRKRDAELVQLEVPGAERPRILPIEDAMRDLLLAEAEVVLLKERVRRATAEVELQLVEHHLVAYTYVDGEFEYPFKLDAKTKLTKKKRKRRTEEERKHDTNDGQSPDREAR